MKTKQLGYIALFSAAFLVATVLILRDNEQSGQLVAYVAGADRSVYMLDLDTGTRLRVSDPVSGIGRPTSLALDPESFWLYIGSERDVNQNDYYPLAALDTNDDFEVVGRYTLDVERSDINQSEPMEVYPVYRIVLSEPTRRLYLGYAAPGRGLATIFDIATEEIVGETEVGVRARSEFSPDGSLVADIYPSA